MEQIYINDSYEFIEDDYYENESIDNATFFPPSEYVMILTFLSLLILVIIEKTFISIFLFFIPSYFLLILTMIILNLILLRYIIVTAIFIGKNKIINFYFRSFVAKKKAKLFIQYLTRYANKLDKILEINKSRENQSNISQLISRSNIIQKYIDVHESIQKKYGTMSSYSKNFYDHLLLLKNKIDNSSLKDIYNKIEKNEEIIISEKENQDFNDIKNEIDEIKIILKEYRDSKSLCPNLIKFKDILYNDILQSKEFIRESTLYKKPNCKSLTIDNKDDKKLDCLFIFSNNNKDGMNPQNLIIVCGPNLIPFDNLIASWDIDSIYLNNGIDLLFWNYRGYGFSEGTADFDNNCDDILSIYDYITNNYKYNKIGVYGFSIGGIASCYLANNRNVCLLIADRTFGSSKGVLDEFIFGKYATYLGKILFIHFVDNTNCYLSAKCNKIILNDVQDQIIIDPISLKSAICKTVIFKIFNETNPEFNLRNIKSKNILDYALEPQQSSLIYNALKYIISFLKNKNQRKNSDYNFINERKFDNDKNKKLNDINNEENINDINNINNEDNININVKETLDIFYEKLRLLFYTFFVGNNSFDEFLDRHSRKKDFNNFFNCLVVYGSEDISLKNYYLCSTKYTDNELNNFITEVNKILNNDEIKKISENPLYQRLSYLNDCIKSLKIFIAGLKFEEIENQWLRQMKGILIPLNCGHTSFYYEEKTINTLIYLIKETFISNDSIAIEHPLYENNEKNF